jgi:hypothetical protein
MRQIQLNLHASGCFEKKKLDKDGWRDGVIEVFVLGLLWFME